MDIFKVIFIGFFAIQVLGVLVIAYFLDSANGAEVIDIKDITMQVVNKKTKNIHSKINSTTFGNHKYLIFLESVDNPEKKTTLKCNYGINIFPEYSGLSYSKGDIVVMQEVTYRKNNKSFKRIKFASILDQRKFQKYLNKQN